MGDGGAFVDQRSQSRKLIPMGGLRTLQVSVSVSVRWGERSEITWWRTMRFPDLPRSAKDKIDSENGSEEVLGQHEGQRAA
jgi:hypothetical protein